jgi:rhamnosyl/mannosyltransferase
VDVNNINILQLAKFFPPNWGGIETVTHNLHCDFISNKLKSSVIVFGDIPVAVTNEINVTSVHFCKYKNFFGAPFSLSYLYTFFSQKNHHQFVIIHLPNPIAIISLLTSRYEGKVIIYWHSDIINKGLLGRLISPLDHWIIKRADIVFSPTIMHTSKSIYKNLFSFKKIVVAPYLPSEKINSVAREHCGKIKVLSSDVIHITAIGRLVTYKGFKYLIEAISELKKMFNVHLNLIGDGPLFTELNDLSMRLDMSNLVTFHGSLSEDRKFEILSKSDIFSFPSVNRAEMYGMVLYEAMAFGLPIVASFIPDSGVVDVVKSSNCGLFSNPYDSKSIASQISNLICNKDLFSKLSENGPKAIQSIFCRTSLSNNIRSSFLQ